MLKEAIILSLYGEPEMMVGVGPGVAVVVEIDARANSGCS